MSKEKPPVETGEVMKMGGDPIAVEGKRAAGAGLRAPVDVPAAEDAMVDVEFTNDISDDRKAKLRAKAERQVQEELTAAAADKFFEETLAAMRTAAGIGSKQLGGAQDELVTLVMDLGDLDGSADPFIHLDAPVGKKYYHNCSYTVPRHIANTLIDIMWRMKLSNLNRDGKSVYRNRTYGSVVGKEGARHTGVRETRIN